ncbi:unnamed protein product [Zymoseptoria tritici ST99CH_3D1]|nr:unnamed protein product [Zymoseptoria tritici ST99CH_3D1]
MDIPMINFLNRFQWAAIFGTKARRPPCELKSGAWTFPALWRAEGVTAGQPHCRDVGTQTMDENTINPPSDHEYDVEEPEEWIPTSPPKTGSDGRPEHDEIDQVADEQDVRDGFYVSMEEELSDDYTAGPARFVVATDGIKDCGALLMTHDLSGLVKQALHAERKYAKAEQLEIDSRVQLMNLESGVEREIRAHEYRLRQHKSDEVATDEPESSASSKELENLRLLLKDIEQRKRTATAQLNTQAMILRSCNKALMACLEDAFTCAEIAEPEPQEPEIYVEPLDVQQEYQAFCERLRGIEEGSPASSVVALNIRGETYAFLPEQVLTPEQQLEVELKDAYHSARDRLQTATCEFDQRETTRQHEQHSTDEDEHTFDLRWVQRISDLTRELIEAEEGLAAAKTAAKEAGLNITLEYQSSGFADTEGDGYRMSFDDELIGTAQVGKIAEWLSEIDEDMSSETPRTVDVDSWEAKDVEICDSVSLVAYGPHRRKIDGWQQDCRRCNEE